MTNTFKKYAQLKSEQLKINEELTALNPKVLKEMGKEFTISNGVGKFTKVIRKNYEFSSRLYSFESKMKGKLSQMKNKEIDGGASFKESQSLRYDFPKSLVN